MLLTFWWVLAIITVDSQFQILAGVVDVRFNFTRKTTMEIGIIGAGQIGSTLALKLGAAGHSIKLANSRAPDTLAALASKIGASAASALDAVKDVGVVIISIPQKGISLLPRGLFVGVPEDVVVVDTGNYYPGYRDDPVEAIERGAAESRWVAQELRRPVVKAFNSITAHSLANEGRPSGASGRIALPVSGDDADAKSLVMSLVDAIGFDGVDAGNLDDSWRQQPGTPVYCTDYDAEGVRQALARADRSRAPELRDLRVQKMAELPVGFDPRDLVNLARAAF